MPVLSLECPSIKPLFTILATIFCSLAEPCKSIPIFFVPYRLIVPPITNSEPFFGSSITIALVSFTSTLTVPVFGRTALPVAAFNVKKLLLSFVVSFTVYVFSSPTGNLVFIPSWSVFCTLCFFESIVGATEKATGSIVDTVGGVTLTVGGVVIVKAVIVGGVTVIDIFGAVTVPGVPGVTSIDGTVGAFGAFGALGASIETEIVGAFGASGGFISNELITISDISGSLISGAFNGVFTFGSTLGASIPSTTGSSIVNGIACLLTSFGEIRASISTSLVGSLIFNKSTNPHVLLPLVDEYSALSFSTFPAPLNVFNISIQEANESFPGVNGVLLTFLASRASIAFFTFQSPLVCTAL